MIWHFFSFVADVILPISTEFGKAETGDLSPEGDLYPETEHSLIFFLLFRL